VSGFRFSRARHVRERFHVRQLVRRIEPARKLERIFRRVVRERQAHGEGLLEQRECAGQVPAPFERHCETVARAQAHELVRREGRRGLEIACRRLELAESARRLGPRVKRGGSALGVDR